jgi:hypothetical protein
MNTTRHLRSFSAFAIQHLRLTQLKTVGLLLCASLIGLPMTAAAEGDQWVGRYRTTWIQGSPGTDGEVSIARAPDATTVAGPDADRARWAFSSPGKNKTIVLRRFLPEEYEGLNSTAPSECLNGEYVALCRVKPGATISFDGGGPVPEKFVARTGYYGIFMHNGAAAFELAKLNSTR